MKQITIGQITIRLLFEHVWHQGALAATGKSRLC